MLLNELPVIINPQKLCQSSPVGGLRVVGKILLSKLPNLDEVLEKQATAEVSVSIVFSMDSEGYSSIAGELAVDLLLTCQRCLQPMEQPIRATFLVSPVVSDAQAERLPSRYEPLMTIDNEIVVAQWIAEELYLALPFVPRHDYECVSHDTYKSDI